MTTNRFFAVAVVLASALAESGCSEHSTPASAFGGAQAAGTAVGSAGSAGSAGVAGSAGRGAGSSAAGTRAIPEVPGCHASAPPLTPAKLPPAIVGVLYSQTLETQGATSDELSWVVRPELPEGLMLVPLNKPADPTLRPPRAYAELRGLPSKAGSYYFEVSATYKFPTMCSVAPAHQFYEFVIAPADDADAGLP